MRFLRRHPELVEGSTVIKSIGQTKGLPDTFQKTDD